MDMTRLLLVIALALTGCVDAPDDPSLDWTEQAVTGFATAPQNYYYYQAGAYWFEDSYSGKWCTNAKAETATWDYGTACNWNQWYDTSYQQYCSAGSFWQNKYYHYHCP